MLTARVLVCTRATRRQVALSLSAVGVLFASRWLLHTPQYPQAWWKFSCCGLLGLCNALTFLQLAQYYTDYAFEPVRRIAAASTTGHGTNIIIGIAVGLESTALAAACTGVSILIAYHLGDWAIPGGMVDAGETVGDTLRREFIEEAGAHMDENSKAHFDKLTTELFAKGELVYRGCE